MLSLCQTFLSFSSADQELKRLILLLFVSLLDEFCACLPGTGAHLKFKEVMGTKESKWIKGGVENSFDSFM